MRCLQTLWFFTGGGVLVRGVLNVQQGVNVLPLDDLYLLHM